MKKLKLLVGVHLETIIKSPLHDVIHVSTSAGEIGFISTVRDTDGDEISVTPFTAAGLMDDAHCQGCGIKDLAACYFHQSREAFDVVESEVRSRREPASTLAALLTAAVLSSK